MKQQMKRQRSSDTETETPTLAGAAAESVEKVVTEMEQPHMESTATAEYILTDFMDKVDCSWDDTFAKITTVSIVDRARDKT